MSIASVSRSELDLAARRAIQEIEGETPNALEPYADPSTGAYQAMKERIRRRLNLTTLKYQHLDDEVHRDYILAGAGCGSVNSSAFSARSQASI